MAMMMVTIGNF